GSTMNSVRVWSGGAGFVDSGGETHAASNQTIDSPANGPRVVADFYTGSSGSYTNGFVNPASDGNGGAGWTPTQVPATPAPDTFGTQVNGAVAYNGDRWAQRGLL